jgi:hypothetical protein
MVPNVEIRLVILGQLPRAVQHRLREFVQFRQGLVTGIAAICLDDDRRTCVLLWIELGTDDGSRKAGPVAGGDEFECGQFAVRAAVEDVVDDVDVHLDALLVDMLRRRQEGKATRTQGLFTQRSHFHAWCVFDLGDSSGDSKSDLLIHGLFHDRAFQAWLVGGPASFKIALAPFEESFKTIVLGHNGFHREADLIIRSCVLRAWLSVGCTIFKHACENGVGNSIGVNFAGDRVGHDCQPALARSRSGVLALVFHGTSARKDWSADVQNTRVCDRTCF